MSVIARAPSSPPAKGRTTSGTSTRAISKPSSSAPSRSATSAGCASATAAPFPSCSSASIATSSRVGPKAPRPRLSGLRGRRRGVLAVQALLHQVPYTEDDGASELLDYPRLMGREKTVRARRDGIPLVDRILGEPQLIGKMSSGVAAPAAQLVQASRLLRKVQEKVTGISAEFPLPPPAQQTFGDWFAAHTPASKAGDAGEVVLFATCTGDYNPAHPRRGPRAGAQRPGVSSCPGTPPRETTGADLLRHADARRGRRRRLRRQGSAQRGGAAPPRPRGAQGGHAPADLRPDREARVARAPRNTGGQGGVGGGGGHDGAPGAARPGEEAGARLRQEPGHRRLPRALPPARPEHRLPGGARAGRGARHRRGVVEQCSAVDGNLGDEAKHYETGRSTPGSCVRGIARLEADMVVSDAPCPACAFSHENGVRVSTPSGAGQALRARRRARTRGPARVAEPATSNEEVEKSAPHRTFRDPAAGRVLARPRALPWPRHADNAPRRVPIGEHLPCSSRTATRSCSRSRRCCAPSASPASPASCTRSRLQRPAATPGQLSLTLFVQIPDRELREASARPGGARGFAWRWRSAARR